jgi:hypothetical protein
MAVEMGITVEVKNWISKSVCDIAPKPPKGARMTATTSPHDLPLLPDGPPGNLTRCSVAWGHSEPRKSLLPQATRDGAQLRTSRGSPHHQMHAPPATHMAFPFASASASSWYACRGKMACSGSF